MIEHIKALSLQTAPRICTPKIMSDFFEQEGLSVSTRTLTNYIGKWLEIGVLEKAAFGIFINNQLSPLPMPDEAAEFVRHKAVVSLQRVLGNSGVLNNPSHFITCVLPYGSGVKDGIIKSGSTTFHFSKIHPSLIPNIKDEWFEDAFDARATYLRATPEKALLDWIYLGSLKNQYSHSLPPQHDLDWDLLDEDKLKRLAHHMKLEEKLVGFTKSIQPRF